MTLGAYIEGQIKLSGRPTYAWSDWECRDYYMMDPPENYLAEMSDAAALALTIASAEWISCRLSPLHPDPMPHYVQMAGWAYMLEPRACLYFEPSDDLWRGPIRAPLSIMAVILMDALYCRDAEPNVRIRTHWMVCLTRYILQDDAAAFDGWLNWAIAHVTQLHPHSEMPTLGLFDIPERFEPIVGKSLFEPGTAYDPSKARQELFEYVTRSDRNNPMIDFNQLRS